MRTAGPSERAAFNFIAHLDERVAPFNKLLEKMRKDIGESAEWLDASEHNQLNPIDIWLRWYRECDDLEKFNRRLRQLEGRPRTAILAEGLANACVVFYLFNEYAHEATGVYGKILHMELADLGTLQTSRLAYDLLGWHLG